MQSQDSWLRIIDRFMKAAAGIPREWTRPPARAAGLLWYWTDRRHRTVAQKNLSIAFGGTLDEQARRRLCRECFQHLVQVFLKLPYVYCLNASDAGRFITFQGMEHLYRAMEKKRGVLVLASHFGNWELMSIGFSLLQFPIHVIARPIENPLADAFITRLRSIGGTEVISKKGSFREILRALHRGRVVAILLDQNAAAHEGVFVPFFGKTACTHKAMAILALRTGAPVVPVYNFREPGGHYRMVFLPEIPLKATGDMERDIRENTSLYNSTMEGYIRLYPEQWFWVHRRWKTQPGVSRARQKAEYGMWQIPGGRPTADGQPPGRSDQEPGPKQV